MFCTKCGAQVPEGNAFCTACGNKVGAVPAQQPIQRPVQQPVQQAAQQPEQPKAAFKLPKINMPSAAAKDPNGEKKPFVNPFAGNKPLLLKVMSIACALLLVLSYVVAINTSFEKIPIVSFVFNMSGEEVGVDELKEEFEELAEQMEEGYEDKEDELKELLSKSELKSLEKFIDVVKACSKSFSLNNMSKLVSCYEDLADTDLDELSPSISDAVSEAKEIQTILNIVKVILLIGALGCALFVFLGGFNAIPGLAIFGTVLTVLYGLSFITFLMLLLNLAAQIYMIVLASQVKKEKKAAAAAAAAYVAY